MGLFDSIRGRQRPQGSVSAGEAAWFAADMRLRLPGIDMKGSLIPVESVPDAVWNNPTGHRCVQARSTNVARPPFTVTVRGEQADTHPLLDLLNRPQPRQSGTAFVQEMSRDLLLTGRYLAIKQTADGEVWAPESGTPPARLLRRNPKRVTVLQNDDEELLGFVYTDSKNRQLVLLPDEVVYVEYPHPDRLGGYAPALAARLGVQTDDLASTFNIAVLANDGSPGGLLLIPGLRPHEFAEAKAMWDADNSPGAIRALGAQGANYIKLASSNKEMAYDVLRNLAADDIMRAFGCSPAAIGRMSGETFANADAGLEWFIQQTVSADWVLFADALTVGLARDFDPDAAVGFDLSEISELQEDKDARTERDAVDLERGVVTINEVRESRGLDPVPWGDVPWTPGQPLPARTAPARAQARHAAAVTRAAERAVGTLTTAAEREQRSAARKGRPAAPLDPGYWQSRVGQTVAEPFDRIADEVLLASTADDAAEQRVRTAVRRTAQEFAEAVMAAFLTGRAGPDPAGAVSDAHDAALDALNNNSEE